MPEIKPVVVLGHMFATDDTQYPHTRFVDQSTEKLGCDQEVLTAPASPHLIVALALVVVGVGGGGVALGTGDVHQALMHHAFIARVHTLVDFVDDAEWRGGEGLERHEVEDGTDCSFATGLAVRVEEGEAFVFAELDVDLNRPLVEVTATRTSTTAAVAVGCFIGLSLVWWFFFGFVQGDLACASDASKGVGKGVADPFHQCVEFRFPFTADFVDCVVVFR